MISAAELRARSFAKARAGYDPQQVQDCLLEAATSIEDLEATVEHLRLRLAEAESAVAATARGRTVEPAGNPPDEVLARIVQVVESWGSDPDRQAMQLAVGRAFVDAELAASRILGEAERDAQDLLGLVGAVVERLTALVGRARSSVQASAKLPSDLAAYESELARVVQAVHLRRHGGPAAGADGLARLAARQVATPSRPFSEA